MVARASRDHKRIPRPRNDRLRSENSLLLSLVREDVIDASKIREHMEVRGSDGIHVGTVDHLDGEGRIKLTRSDPASGGQHHLIALDDVQDVDSDGALVLKHSSEETKRGWTTA